MDWSGRVNMLRNRYVALITVLSLMLYVHTSIILIHPLLFLVWPACLWLLIEIYNQWKTDIPRYLLFSLTFLAYLVATQLLVVENTGGIFFDIKPFPNMVAISYFVLMEVMVLYVYDTLILHKTTYRSTPAYVGFASVIPWLSPALVEIVILFRWIIEGTFTDRTLGKGLGAASLNDILFLYGFRNFVYSVTIFFVVLLILTLSDIMMARRMNLDAKRLMVEKNRDWHSKAWGNPISLLSQEERRLFTDSYGHLDEEQQKKILRCQVLPKKGINLVDPDS
jgi:hypothetical protein